MQTVHLVVDSGELGQPDVTFGLKGMVRRPNYNGAHTGGRSCIWRFIAMVIYFCKSMRDSTSPP